MLPQSLQSVLPSFLFKHFQPQTAILNTRPVGGGDINTAVCIETSQGRLFLKYNDASRFPGMFEAEARGLGLLRATQSVGIPGVIGTGSDGVFDFLVMEYVEPGPRSHLVLERFGKCLAEMHRMSSGYFGLDHSNYMGSLPQINTPASKWTDFFRDCRLRAMLKPAYDRGFFEREILKAFENLYNRLEDMIPPEPPSLLHGDLWAGNFMASWNEEPFLIDPAVCFGHREADLAMTRLFGGFGEAFYASYQDSFPLEKGWESRMDVFNLYPLLVHVNLFGSGYVGSVKQIIQRFR